MESIFLRKSIEEIHASYVNKTLDPIDVAKSCIDSIDAYNAKYKALAYCDLENLLKKAKETSQNIVRFEKIRILEGMPIGISDTINAIGFPIQTVTSSCERILSGNDARIVYYVKNEGGLILGKTSINHSLINLFNRHGNNRSIGASSGLAVALGMVPVVIENQVADSIVRSASLCGIYGCKPSFGLIPLTGLLRLANTLDSVGFLTSFFTNIAPIFEVLSVHGPNYPISHRLLNDSNRQYKPESRPWRVAFVRTHTWKYAPQYAQDALTEFIYTLSQTQDIEIIETEIPEEIKDAYEVHSILCNKSLEYYSKAIYDDLELTSPIVALDKNEDVISVHKYQMALKAQEHLAGVMDTYLEDYDVMISLSTAGAEPLWSEIELPNPTVMWTTTHLPVISVPIFRSPEGLPFGAQIVARRFNDKLLFSFCMHLISLNLIPVGSNTINL